MSIQPFQTVVIPDPQNPYLIYNATKKDGQVTVIHKPKNPVPGMLGGGGTMQRMSEDEFKQFMIETIPQVKAKGLERSPAGDTFLGSRSALDTMLDNPVNKILHPSIPTGGGRSVRFVPYETVAMANMVDTIKGLATGDMDLVNTAAQRNPVSQMINGTAEAIKQLGK